MASVASASAKFEPIKVLVTDNTPMGADLLARTLKRDRRFQVVGTIFTRDEIVKAARNDQPDIVILTHLDDDSPIRFRTVRELRASLPSLKLVVILDHCERSLVVEAFRAGAKGILCRNASVKSLGKCLESVHEGQIWANSAEMQYVLDALVESPPIRVADSKGDPILTNQEQAVVHWMTEGLSNREIAAQLNLSEHTVKNYIFRIFDKLGVSKRVEVILYALNKRGATAAKAASADADSIHEDRLVFEWSRSQAAQGSAAAAFILGQMFRDGRGTGRDLISAYAWFVSAQLGSPDFRDAGRLACENLTKKMSHEEILAALSCVAELRAASYSGAPENSNAMAVEIPVDDVNTLSPGNGKQKPVPDRVPETN